MNKLNLSNIQGKRVLIVGLGKSGIAAAQAMVKLEAVVSVQDSKEREKVDGQLINFLESKNVTLYLGGEMPLDMRMFDMMILSPGVYPEADYVRDAES